MYDVSPLKAAVFEAMKKKAGHEPLLKICNHFTEQPIEEKAIKTITYYLTNIHRAAGAAVNSKTREGFDTNFTQLKKFASNKQCTILTKAIEQYESHNKSRCTIM